MKQFLWIPLLLIQYAHATERSESFVIKAYDNRFKVTAPHVFSPNVGLIIENHTLTKIYGKIETKLGRIIDYISILPRNFKSISLNLRTSQNIIFTPLVPPLQEVELIFGKEAYEIPPKK